MEARRYRVLHQRRTGQGGGGGWGPAVDTEVLLPLEVRQWAAPRHDAARLAFNGAAAATGGRAHVWDWRAHAGTDDRVTVIDDHPDPAERHVVFTGFLVDADWQFDTREALALTANGVTWRFRDQADLVHGRWMAGLDGVVDHYNGPRCSFNAGGRPNAAATRAAVAGGPSRGVAVFAGDDAPGARWWGLTDAVEYLLWRHNAGQPYVLNHAFTDADYATVLDPVIQVDVDGLDLWSALAAVADHGRADVFVDYALAGDAVTATVRVQRRDAGTLVEVAHQPPSADGTPSAFDERATDLFAADVAESVASCVTAPVVVGGRDLVEISVELQPAWSASDLSLPTGQVVRPGAEDAEAASDYVSRYCVGGAAFTSYAAVGRLWDANTDGFHTSLGLTVTDVAALAGQTAGSWPAMAYAPRRLVTRIAAGPLSAGVEAVAEFTLDAGANWHPLTGFRLLPGRLGLWISKRNLASIVPPATAPDAASLIDVLLATPASVGVRLTCSIEAPTRCAAGPARRNSAGTCFGQSAWIDRGARAQTRTVAASSIFSGSSLPADTADGAAELAAVARLIQDLNEDRLVEASLPVEWPSAEIALGDRVRRIVGIDVDLRTNCGASARYPRVVGRRFMLTPGTYQTHLVLDTDRKGGVL